MELEELKNELEILQMNNVKIYFHLTENGNGESINENGIFLDNKMFSSTANALNESFFENPEYYLDYKTGNPQTRRKDIMVFIGCYDGDEEYLIRKASDDNYNISSENILGYLDIENKFFVVNPNNSFDIGYNL